MKLLPLALISCSIAIANTYTSSTCNVSDIQTQVNLSANGDIVSVPAGTCTWSSVLTISKNITLQGAGQGVTVIQDNVASSSGQALVWNVSGGTLARLTGFTIQPASGASLAGFARILGDGTNVNFREDDITFTGWTYTNNSYAVNMTDNLFGVIDHVTFSGSFSQFLYPGNSAWNGTGANGDNSWASPDNFGTEQMLYVESNTFSNDVTQAAVAVIDCNPGVIGNGGCRVAIRHNTFTNAYLDMHGTESGGRYRSARQIEFYNNSLIDNASGGEFVDTYVDFRGGTGYVFNNTVTALNGGGYNSLAKLADLRAGDTFSPWGYCAGGGSWDNNNGTMYATGTATTGTTTDSLVVSGTSWTTNQWFVSGDPYSLCDITVGVCAEIASNTSNTIVTLPASAAYGHPHAFASGDTYQIKRASICIDQPGHGAGTYISGLTPTQTGWVSQASDPIYVWNNTLTDSPWQAPVTVNNTARLVANRDYYYCSGTSCAPSGYTPYIYPHPLTQATEPSLPSISVTSAVVH